VNTIDREAAARKVAARYSTHLDMATHQYMIITGLLDKAPKIFQDEIEHCFDEINELAETTNNQLSLDNADYCYPLMITCAPPFVEAQKEMLGLIPGYRHPVKSLLLEQGFFGGTLAELYEDKIIVPPSWIQDLHQLPEPLKQKIVTFVNEAELIQRQLNNVQKERDRLQKLLTDVTKAYKKKKKGERINHRNTRVTEVLGLSKGRGNTPSLDHHAAYYKYVYLVRHQGKKRIDALEILMEEFRYKSLSHVRKELNTVLNIVKKDWKEINKDQFYDVDDKDIEKYWKGLIPQIR